MTWTPPYLKVWIRHCYLPPKLLQYVAYAVTLHSHGRAEAGGHKQKHILLLFNSHDSFHWQIFHEPLTLNIFMYTKSTFESFYTLAIITTKHEADNRVDSTVSVNHKVGYSKVYLETTREMGRTVLILYD